jgi:hypothetical protein
MPRGRFGIGMDFLGHPTLHHLNILHGLARLDVGDRAACASRPEVKSAVGKLRAAICLALSYSSAGSVFDQGDNLAEALFAVYRTARP